ncbi:TonB-dependent receptor [Roseomonas marmotae]|uniref:TonB-dependent siderophore receptor n=1 Tax=Roseomonas marmotae TaxID=2768161 RepID=A0ABS3KBD6_9PROT|nr:TonB-dependent siderophore receptor [Roseomonas marmotae]MBO1074760.1 TonB-dependent siderophore receptor [Roseomonas marmotae]QTI80730.1 TonB-dependent siderophore receptor [Roseomonas marmotae]
MSRRQSLTGTVSQAALMAGVAMALPGTAEAQGAAAEGPVMLPTVEVQGSAPANTLQRAVPVNRLSGTVQDTPQVINVVPREVLEQQNVTTLEEALRNVPGITMSAGEGNGGVSGDQFRIRGFSAQNDIYVDGLRDFGAYQRDAFTYEDVAVMMGPSGYALGTGSVGGGVAINTRLPRLGNSLGAVATGGMGPFARFTADGNYQFSDTGAVRLNLMGQSNSAVDRDTPSGHRWGFAPSIAFGLGTDTTFSLDYLHYEYDQPTDAGIPVISRPGFLSVPATELGLPRGTWYGTGNDRDKVTVDRLTARLSHQVSDWLTLSNDFRVGWYDRDFAFSPVACDATCSAAFLRGGNPAVSFGGGVSPYKQKNWSIQNISTATARFTTGPLRHELTAGFDLWHEDFERRGFSYTSPRPAISIRDGGGTDILQSVSTDATNFRDTKTTGYGLFANERVWLLPELSVIGGLRWSRYEIDYAAGTPGAAASTNIKSDVDVWDPRVAVVFEPTGDQTYYASYSTSSTPPGSYFTTFPAAVTQFRQGFKPERNTIYELGAKFGLLDDGRLGAYGALYRIEKDNSLQTDPATGDATQTSDKQRNQGFELGLTGRVTPDWNVLANYTWMDSETTESTTAANVGKRVQYVPKHAAALWTTYDFNRDTPMNVTVGGGITWRSKVFLDAANTAQAPSNFSLDAVISHRINDSLRVQVNGYNLTNEVNYSALFGGRVVPSPGRTVLVSVAAEF